MAQCSVCSHERAKEINKWVLTGRQIKAASVAFGINRGTLYSHMRNHLPWKSSRKPPGVTIAEQMTDLKMELSRLQILAEAGDDVDGPLKVLRERRMTLELEARMQNELGSTHAKLMPRGQPEGDYEVKFEGGRPKTIRVVEK